MTKFQAIAQQTGRLLTMRIPGFPTQKRSKPPAWQTRLARVIFYFILAAIGAFGLWRILLFRDVNAQFARIRAGGFPVSGTELNAWRPTVPDGENGALVMSDAFALMRNFPDRRSNDIANLVVIGRTNQWPVATEIVRQYVQSNGPALVRAGEACQSAHFRYPADFSYGPETLLPHLAKLKELAWIAQVRAAIEADGGDTNQWPADVRLELKLAGTLDEEPIFISYLVRNALVRMAVQTTERSLNRVSASAEACKTLQAEFEQTARTNLLPSALIGERAISIPIFRLSRAEAESFGDNDDPKVSGSRPPQRYRGKPNPGLWFTGFFERDLNFYLETMEKSTSLARLPFPECLAMSNYLADAGRVARNRIYFMSSMLLPSYSIATVKEANTKAFAELAATALAIERFRQERQRLPGNLPELVPQFMGIVPADPFDGNPLRYKRLTRGYVIYSIGSDGHDDGGREPPVPKKGRDNSLYDLTFVVER